MKLVLVKPKTGMRVRIDQLVDPVPAKGVKVTLTRDVRRRIADGDLINIDAEKAAAKAKKDK